MFRNCSLHVVTPALALLAGAPAFAAAASSAAPVITAISPASGPVGTVVTITGSNFLGATSANSGLGIYSPSPGYWVKGGTVTVVNNQQVRYTIPAIKTASAQAQIYIGNASLEGFAPMPFNITAGSGSAAASSSRSSSSTSSSSASASSSKSSSSASSSTAAATVTVTVTPTNTHAISPYIYGINSVASVTGAPPALTLDRAGGNRWTAYNWETNASNAGSDYLYENDNYLSSSSTPAAAVSSFITADQARGMASLVTFQMQGLVAGDESGPVSVANPPDLSRFKKVVPEKSTQTGVPFTLTPPSTDANVYMDEFIWALNEKFAGQNIFGGTPSSQPVFAQLDNEPELWNSTHLEVQGSTPVTPSTYIAKTIALAKALKTQFPNLVIFGPVHYGFYGIYSWNGALSGVTPSGNNWFPDEYLPAVKSASASFGHPLVDVYDFHWYSEATDGSGNRVTNLNGTSLTAAQVQAIVQSPRSLWDTTYTESSWITSALGQPIYILGRLQARINSENPGMKLSISEYNNGGAQHIAGTIAQADNLGVFGAQAVYAASLWPLTSSESYLLAGFRAFRDFDGANDNFGDTSVQASSSDNSKVTVYVSTDSTRKGRVVMVAINRSTASQVTRVSGQTLSGTAHLYQITAASAASQSTVAPVSLGTQTASGTSLTLTLPALSVTTIDVY